MHLCSARSPTLPSSKGSASGLCLLKVVVVGMLTSDEAEAVREGLRARGVIHDDVFESLDELSAVPDLQ